MQIKRHNRSQPMKMIIFVSLMLTACTGGTMSAIDYARQDSWLALPGLTSPADLTPEGGGFSNLQQLARSDVFYVHPTTSLRADILNVPIDDPDALRLGGLMLKAQATSFNGVARVFAPRYRQRALPTYQLDEEAQQSPTNRAYADVRQAFDYYVEHHNGGRPFFLVGHSQGANHAQRLLSEAIQGTPLEQRLVAAYLPGQPLPRSVFADDLVRIPPCAQPKQIGCVAVWGTFGEDSGINFREWEENGYWNAARQRWMAMPGQPLVNINPVSWSSDEPQTPASRHRGAVPFGVPSSNFTRPRPQLVSVRNNGRYAIVSPPLTPDLFNDGGVFGGANYHVFDINLFWLDLRENARQRLNAFLLHQDKAAYPLIGATVAISAHVGQPFRLQITADNLPAAFYAEGLPSGLSINSATGEISGVPMQPGVNAVVVTATNSAGSYSTELALIVTTGNH